MADNTTLNTGTGGDTLRDKDRAGVKTQIVALDLNPAGTETLMAGAMPVTGTFWQATQPISIAATVTVDTELTTADVDTGAGTDTRAVVGLVLAESGGGLLVGSAHPLPVSGTFWQATQPVSGTVTANLGTLNGAALDASVNGVLLAQASTTSGQKGPLVQGAVTTAAPTYTTAQTSPLSLDTSGSLRVNVMAAANLTVVGTGTFATQAAQSGTWNIGTVTAITNALPAGTNLLGQIAASHETGTVYSGTTALTPKFATFSTSAAGATTVVAAVTSKRIRVLRWRCTANGATNVKWQSHVTPTDISGLSYLTQFSAAGGAYCPVGHFQTISGEALDINNSAAIAISGEVTYIEV